MSAAKALAKPQLRGLLQSQIKKNLAIATAISFGVVVIQKIFVNDEKKRVYAEFYKNYNIDEEFEKIRAKGLFDSC